MGQTPKTYRDAIGSDPENADGYVGLGEALDAQHRAAEAERALRKAVEVEPTYRGAQNALGNFLFRHGHTSAAIATYPSTRGGGCNMQIRTINLDVVNNNIVCSEGGHLRGAFRRHAGACRSKQSAAYKATVFVDGCVPLDPIIIVDRN